MVNNLKLKLTLSAIDRLSGPLRRINAQVRSLSSPATRVGRDLANVTRKAARLTGTLAAMGTVAAGIGALFVKNELLGTAAQFEKFNAKLKTIEGSAAKAEKSMDWISEFATKTPFEFDEVTDSFIKLRNYGFDPTNGLLKTLGDTAAAMGKPLDQAVEAIAEAVMGENERLKEFGIKASVNSKKHKIEYTYVDNGKTITESVDSRNKMMIQSTLEAIFNSRYAGSMALMAKTWDGMMSNVSDQWTRFKLKIMEAGLFDWMKGRLANLLAIIDRMAADGSLERWAGNVGKKLQRGFEMGWAAGKKIYEVLNKLADSVGGFGNLAKISLGVVAAIMTGPLLLAVAQLTQSIIWLFAAFSANPMLAGIMAIAAGLVYVIKNWDDVVGGFRVGIDAIVSWFSEKFAAAINTVKTTIKALGDGFRGIVNGLNPFGSSEKLFAAPLPSAPSYAPGFANRVNMHSLPKPADGKLVVEIQGAPVAVKSLQANSGQIDVKNPRAGVHFP